MPARRGTTTLVDVLAITIVSIAFTAWYTVTAIRAREVAYNVKCASNLRQIGSALLNYNIGTGSWPRTRYEPDTHPPTAFTASNAHNPFADDGPEVNDVTAAYYLLVRAGLDSNVFVCPLSLNSPTIPQNAQGLANFNESNLSYSLANPYPTNNAVKLGMKYDYRSITAEFAVAADMNPGGLKLLTATQSMRNEELSDCLSQNHRRYPAMNVLYGDGHAEAMQSPFSGVQRDNIFTYGGPMKDRGGLGIIGSPVDGDDTVLLPVASAAYWQPYIEADRRDVTTKWTIGFAAVIFLAGFAYLFLFFSRRLRCKSDPAS